MRTDDCLNGGLVSVLQFGSKRGEVGAELDKGANLETPHEVALHAHLGAIGCPAEESPGYNEGLSSGNAEGAVQFFGQQELLKQGEWDTALYPLATSRNGLRTDSEQKIIE